MGTAAVIMIFVVAFTIVTLFKGFRLVPQGSRWVVERLGRFRVCLEPGFNLIIPYVDSVAYKVTSKDIVLDIPSQEVITRDNVVIIANAVAYIRINMPDKAVYEVEDYRLAIRTLVQTSLRSIIGEMDLDDALSSRDKIKVFLKDAISADIQEWGINLKTVEIQDINPSNTMQKAMEEQAAAERERRATVTRADGEKQAHILEADGRLEASKRDARAQVVLAQGSQKAIRLVTDAVGDQEMPVMYLLGEKYVASLEKIAASDNSKTVILPADLPKALSSMITR